MTMPDDINTGQDPPAQGWGAAVETPEADRREQDLPVSPDPASDPETIVHRSTASAADRTPLQTTSEFDAIDQTIEVPFDDEDR